MNKMNQMNIVRPRRILLRFISIVFAIIFTSGLLVGSRASAQGTNNGEPDIVRSDSLEITVKAGFGRLEVNALVGAWAPVRVTLANQGQAINGRLVVHCESPGDPNPQVREYVKPINLPTGSRQTFEIAAFFNSSERPRVQVVDRDGRVIAEALMDVDARYGTSGQLEVLVVDTDGTALKNITSTPIARAQGRAPFMSRRATSEQQAKDPNASSASQDFTQPPPQPGPRGRQSGQGQSRQFEAQPKVISPDDLPREYISYDTVDAVVIGEAPLNQLSQEQSRALKLWVASGGLLIVTGGADMAGINAIGLADMLPIEAQATSSASLAALPEITDVYGQFESAEALTLMTARAKPDARVLVGAAERPIVAERNFGSGLVRFVAINPKLHPFRGWLGAKDLWTDLLLPAAETKPRNVNMVTLGGRRNSFSSRWGLKNYLFRLGKVEPPSPKFFLLFLLFYVLTVGPMNYFLLRWKRKTDLAWLTIPSVVLLFTVVSVVVAQASRGSDSIVADVSFVELHQREAISRALGGMLIMPASKGAQEVAFVGRDSYANDVYNGSQSSSASAAGVIEAERTQSGLVMRLPMATWTSGLFQFRSISENATPLVAATESAAGSVTVRNLSDARITRAVYLSAAGVSEPFDLSSGSEETKSLTAPQSLSFNEWYLKQLGEESDEGSIYTEFAFLLDRQVGGDQAFREGGEQGFFEFQKMTDALRKLERPLLICFIDKQPSEIKFEDSFKRQSKAFYVIHL